jgi:hypothetical protein
MMHRLLSRRAIAAGALAVAGGVASWIWGHSQATCEAVGRIKSAGPPRDDPPYLILLQRRTIDTHTSRTPYILENMDLIERQPFDGMVVNIAPSWLLMQGKPLTYRDIYDSWLGPLKGKFKKFTHNFVEVMIDDPGDLFDDRAWAITVENWRLMARAAREAGFVGIFFDDEEYTGHWLNYPEDYDNPTHSLEEYQAQTRLRGTQIMEAIVGEFPDIVLLAYHGPYLSEPKTPETVIAGQAGPGDTSDLTGSLFVGFLQGLGPDATLVDGGEVYAYRTPSDFSQSYQWRKHGIASEETDSQIIPEADRLRWAGSVSISFGVYNLPFPPDRTQMSPAIMRSTLENALRVADRYVWYYTYEDNWLLPNDMPVCWRTAVEDARDAVGLNSRPGSPLRASRSSS